MLAPDKRIFGIGFHAQAPPLTKGQVAPVARPEGQGVPIREDPQAVFFQDCIEIGPFPGVGPYVAIIIGETIYHQEIALEASTIQKEVRIFFMHDDVIHPILPVTEYKAMRGIDPGAIIQGQVTMKTLIDEIFPVPEELLLIAGGSVIDLPVAQESRFC